MFFKYFLICILIQYVLTAIPKYCIERGTIEDDAKYACRYKYESCLEKATKTVVKRNAALNNDDDEDCDEVCIYNKYKNGHTDKIWCG